MLIQNVMKCIDQFSPDYMFDAIVDTITSVLQLSLRLYLKFVKKINSSNELLSIKVMVVLFIVSISYFFPLPESSQSYVVPFIVIYSIMLTTIIFDHSGFNQFFMEIHPNFYSVSSAIRHLLVLSYNKSKKCFTSAWNTMKLMFLNLCRSNEVQIYLPD